MSKGMRRCEDLNRLQGSVNSAGRPSPGTSCYIHFRIPGRSEHKQFYRPLVLKEVDNHPTTCVLYHRVNMLDLGHRRKYAGRVVEQLGVDGTYPKAISSSNYSTSTCCLDSSKPSIIKHILLPLFFHVFVVFVVVFFFLFEVCLERED